jgi:hypothetical protein
MLNSCSIKYFPGNWASAGTSRYIYDTYYEVADITTRASYTIDNLEFTVIPNDEPDASEAIKQSMLPVVL